MPRYLYRIDTKTIWEAWIEADTQEEADKRAEAGDWDETWDCDIDYVYLAELLRFKTEEPLDNNETV